MTKIIDLSILLNYAETRPALVLSAQIESSVILNGLSRSPNSLRILNVRLSVKFSILLIIDLYLKLQQLQQFSKERAKGNFQSCCQCSYRLGLWRFLCHITSAVWKLDTHCKLIIKFPLQSMGEVNHPLKCLFLPLSGHWWRPFPKFILDFTFRGLTLGEIRECSGRTRRHGFKLNKGRFRFGISKKFFT